MIFAPLLGFRHVEVTDQRRSIDFAHVCQDIVDVHFPDAEKILIVCDNLNTHKPGSLYKAFDAQEAERIAEKLEFHYTPKHGSWLNIAEIEFSVLRRKTMSFKTYPRPRDLSNARCRHGKTGEISKAPRSTGDLRLTTRGSNSKNYILQLTIDIALA